MKYEKERFDAMADIVKAAAHPVRLFILEALSQQRYCVKEFTAALKLDMSTVSKHLLKLKNHGLITDCKEGNCVYYQLTCNCVKEMNKTAYNILKQNINRQNALLKESK
ncbi:MAG: metalloregulator ArsR/SmtB family transcription factor [Candidatus Cloacimonetes bacterium]|nr:metalloregulator ArsR/SmtB family transcription factor [Candidatus Cloacimonadota bacterium]